MHNSKRKIDLNLKNILKDLSLFSRKIISKVKNFRICMYFYGRGGANHS